MNRRILVAENQPETLDAMGSSLRSTGYEIMTAANGLQALKEAGTGQPDLIILDSKLPDISGAVVCDIMRRLPSTAAIPIILITDPSDELARILGTENGADDCLTRPFTPQALAWSISQTFMRREEAAVAQAVAAANDRPHLEGWRG
jgi:DNA-binding response OmpR family regulator